MSETLCQMAAADVLFFIAIAGLIGVAAGVTLGYTLWGARL